MPNALALSPQSLNLTPMSDSPQTVLIFKGATQYGASNHFLDAFDATYRSLGLNTVVIDLSSQSEAAIEQLKDAILNQNVLFAIGINANGQFKVDDKSIYDIARIPHVSWLMDHPVYHLEPVQNLAQDFGVVAVVDRDHGPFLQAAVSPEPASLFLPHGGCLSPDTPDQERDLDLLFSGTGVSPESVRDEWANHSETARSCYEAGLALSQADPELRLMDMASQVFQNLGLAPARDLFVDTMLQVERYLRAHERYSMLKTLDDAGQPAHIFGNGWDFAQFTHHQLHASVPFEESIALLKRSKISLNLSSFFKDGAHDRIFSAMLGGAISATNTSPYLEELPGFQDCALTFSPNSAPLPDQIRSLLAQPKQLADQAASGKAFAAAGHTFAHRAQTLLNSITEAFPSN
ncbi:hypothetical protein VDG1235_1486 [Verrucomicrobiia bacterium DG1235]|nr:hypothetical protein VDG1235_1486 [Verrucomicrobiae bacterium DG1235]